MEKRAYISQPFEKLKLFLFPVPIQVQFLSSPFGDANDDLRSPLNGCRAVPAVLGGTQIQ